MEQKLPNFGVGKPNVNSKALHAESINLSENSRIEYRFRKNVFEKVSRWYWPFEEEIDFFSIVKY